MEHISFTLARLELQGGHYEEALRLYREILQQEPQSSAAWCGMAMARYGLVLEGKAKVTEAFYCFRMAREVEPAEAEWVEYLMVQASIKVVEELYKRFHHYHHQLSQASGKKGLSLVGGVSGALLGESQWAEGHVYRSMLAAGLTAYSVHTYFKADASEATLRRERHQWTEVLSWILWQVDHKVVVALEEKRRFHEVVARLRRELAEAETPGWVKTLKCIKVDDAGEKPQARPWSEAMKQYAAFLRQQAQVRAAIETDPQHPFHRLKQEVLVYFNNHQYREAYKRATEALTVYALDEELLLVQQQVRKRLVTSMSRVAGAVLLLFTLLYLFKNRLAASLDLPGKLFIFLLLVLFLFAVYLGLRWVDRKL